ncbi:MAG: DNA polymerase III subunit delta' [Sulfurospirillaceae bacterium]|nr:DNA polymerase III subunit delta' [Sulfurospirillaceae bacterium]MDD2825881.1 DNA polymerase III subunit delta' [Sulfurospirillaceae bacterium]
MSEEALFSHLLICANIEKATEILEERYVNQRHLFYVKNEFLLDDAKELVKEAYIAEAKTKFLIVVAKSYRIEAQNSLLKILEEPPRNIIFVLVAPSKNAFLPTIRSRLQYEELDYVHEKVSSGLNLKQLDLSDIYPFVQANAYLEKNLLKEMIQSIVFEAIHVHHLDFSEGELEHFQKLVQLAELNSRAQTLLTSLLLSIMQRKRR